MTSFSLDEVHHSWRPFFARIAPEIDNILSQLPPFNLAPERIDIFRAFRGNLTEVKVVIIGQDPYPGKGVADGLAFSQRTSEKTPASLRNIFKELQSDLGVAAPTTCDLTSWSDQGVLLLNRVLTNEIGSTNAHLSVGWQSITDQIAEELSNLDVVAILWGKGAQELSRFFHHRIESAHPSPLSAYRGFFGSRPFSRANQLLQELGKTPVDWKLP